MGCDGPPHFRESSIELNNRLAKFHHLLGYASRVTEGVYFHYDSKLVHEAFLHKLEEQQFYLKSVAAQVFDSVEDHVSYTGPKGKETTVLQRACLRQSFTRPFLGDLSDFEEPEVPRLFTPGPLHWGWAPGGYSRIPRDAGSHTVYPSPRQSASSQADADAASQTTSGPGKGKGKGKGKNRAGTAAPAAGPKAKPKAKNKPKRTTAEKNATKNKAFQEGTADKTADSSKRLSQYNNRAMWVCAARKSFGDMFGSRENAAVYGSRPGSVYLGRKDFDHERLTVGDGTEIQPPRRLFWTNCNYETLNPTKSCDNALDRLTREHELSRAAVHAWETRTYLPEPNSHLYYCLLYTSPSPRDYAASRMPSSA